MADDRVDACNPDDRVSHALLKEAIPLACGEVHGDRHWLGDLVAVPILAA